MDCTLNNPTFVKADQRPRTDLGNGIEVVESNGLIIFNKVPEKSRLGLTGIISGDVLTSVNGIAVDKSNLDTVKKELTAYDLEVVVQDKGRARIRAWTVVKGF